MTSLLIIGRLEASAKGILSYSFELWNILKCATISFLKDDKNILQFIQWSQKVRYFRIALYTSHWVKVWNISWFIFIALWISDRVELGDNSRLFYLELKISHKVKAWDISGFSFAELKISHEVKVWDISRRAMLAFFGLQDVYMLTSPTSLTSVTSFTSIRSFTVFTCLTSFSSVQRIDLLNFQFFFLSICKIGFRIYCNHHNIKIWN